MKPVYVFGAQLLLVALALGQRVAPGVNPRQYEKYDYQHQQQQQQQYQPHQQQQQYQQPSVQHHQQQQQHYQQAPQPQQHQQPQQQQQQQHYQPQPQHGGGHGHHHGSQPNVLGGNVQDEKEHIAEHFEVPMDTSKMTEQELQFHYFKMHDADNNNKLDGCELIKSLIHWHAEQKKSKEQQQPHQENVPEKIFTDEELVSLIDPILSIDDSSKDGFIDYPEFVLAQERAVASTQQKAP